MSGEIVLGGIEVQGIVDGLARAIGTRPRARATLRKTNVVPVYPGSSIFPEIWEKVPIYWIKIQSFSKTFSANDEKTRTLS
jgi:hypothetical protein